MNPAKYVKAIFGAVSALAGSYAVAVQDGSVDATEWATIVLAAIIGFVTVWSATNDPAPAVLATTGRRVE